MKLSHWVSAANTLNAGSYSLSLLCMWIPCSVFEGLTHFVTGYSKSRCLPAVLRGHEHHFHADESISRQMGTVAFAHSADDCCCFLCVCICLRRPENNFKRHSSGVICLFLRQGLYWPFASLIDGSGWLASPNYPSQHRPGLRHSPPHLVFGSRVPRLKLRFSRLQGKNFINRVISQSNFHCSFALLLRDSYPCLTERWGNWNSKRFNKHLRSRKIWGNRFTYGQLLFLKISKVHDVFKTLQSQDEISRESLS